MEVLYVIPAFYPAWEFGGNLPSSYGVIRELSRKGINVTVYTTDAFSRNKRQDKEVVRYENVEVHYFRNLSNYLAWKRLWFSPGLNGALRTRLRDFEIVHLMDLRFISHAVARKSALLWGVPYVVTPLDPFKSYKRRPHAKIVFDSLFGFDILGDASMLFAANAKEVSSYIDFGIERERLRMIPNGIDVQELDIVTPEGMFRNQFAIPSHSNMILFLGRIDHVKGLDVLAQAFSLIIKDPRLKNCVLVIAGPDAGYLRELKRIVRALGIVSKVVFTGPVFGTMKYAAFQDADVFVMPSRYEEFGIAPLEAFGSGAPVIITEECGVNYWMRNHFDRVVQTNASSLANALLSILGIGGFKKSIDRKARLELLDSLFSWDVTASQLKEAYETLMVR